MEQELKCSKKNYARHMCCVVGCTNSRERHRELHFYSFPSRAWEKERKQKWIDAVNRITVDGKPWIPGRSTIICSEHFVGGKKSNDPRNEAFLPTIFPPIFKRNRVRDSDRTDRFKKRNQVIESSSMQNNGTDVRRHFVDEDFSSIATQTKDVGIQTDIFEEIAPDENSATILFCSTDYSTNDAYTQTQVIIK